MLIKLMQTVMDWGICVLLLCFNLLGKVQHTPGKQVAPYADNIFEHPNRG